MARALCLPVSWESSNFSASETGYLLMDGERGGLRTPGAVGHPPYVHSSSIRIRQADNRKVNHLTDAWLHMTDLDTPTSLSV